jgi:hypothetical protein
VKRLRVLHRGETVPEPARSHLPQSTKAARNVTVLSSWLVEQRGWIMWTLISLIYRISCRTTLLAMRRYRLAPMV